MSEFERYPADWPEHLRRRRKRVERAWGLARGSVVVPAGLPVPIAGTDQFHEFHAHPEHRYLAGVGLPGSVLTFDPEEGWSLFLPVVSREEAVWVGPGPAPAAVAAVTGLERVRALGELRSWLEARRGEPLYLLGNDDLLQRPEEYGLGKWETLEFDVARAESEELRARVDEARRIKDAGEIALIRRAVEASVAGHLWALRHARPGMTERALQVEIEAEFFRHDGDRTAYGSIVGAGPDGAILHFAPTRREIRDGELVLIDAGAEYLGYASDVTRTFPAGPRFEPLQRELYELVLGVQERAIGRVRPGADYRDLHLAASAEIAEGLRALGILRGSLDRILEGDAQTLFFPHGLGHMLGLATHDAGGCLPERKRERPALRYLRADLPLAEGMVVTIEPGVYFIRPLLEDREVRETFADEVNWELVDRLLDFGGIRIEDDVLVTAEGAEVLSSGVPKRTAEIEALREEVG